MAELQRATSRLIDEARIGLSDLDEIVVGTPGVIRPGENRLVLRVKGTRDGHPAEEAVNLGFRVGDPPFGPR